MKTCVTCRHARVTVGEWVPDNTYRCMRPNPQLMDIVTGKQRYPDCTIERGYGTIRDFCGPSGKYHEEYKDKPYKDLEVKDIITGPAWTWTEVTVITILLIIVAVSLYSAGHF